MQPGDTIKPHSKPDDAVKSAAASVPEPVPPTTAPVQAEANMKPSEPMPEAVAAESSSWQYAPGDEAVSSQSLAHASVDPVTWSASEFVDNEKNAGWFLTLAGLSVVAVSLIYFITKDVVTIVVVLLAAVLFGVTAKRKPRTLQYQLDHRGIQIGDKGYPYESFKSFSVLEEGAFNSIQLMPLKRFMPPISLYYPPESEQQVVATLGSYLPHEERTHDPIERLMRKVRF